MISQKAQEQATRQLPKHAEALNHALLNPYAPKHFEPLLAYVRDHIFAHLQVYILPADVSTQSALLSLAREVTDAFFATGRAHELGWLCRDFEGEDGVLEVTARERDVRAALRKVIERLLVMPALKQESKKKLVRSLRCWGDDQEWEVLSESEVDSKKKTKKKEKQKGLRRRASVSQLLSKREKPAAFGRIREWPDVRIRSNAAPDAEGMAPWDQARKERTRKAIKDRAAELCAALRVDKPVNPEADGKTDAKVDEKSRVNEPPTDQTEQASRQDFIDDFKVTYLARQESMLTAIQEENKRRQEQDADWARKVEKRLAEEASQEVEERRELAQSWQETQSDGGSEQEEMDVDENHGSKADDYSNVMDAAAEGEQDVSEGQGANGSMGLMAAVIKHDGGWTEAGARKQTRLGRDETSKQQGSLPYFCVICGKRLADMIALNEHALEHFDD